MIFMQKSHILNLNTFVFQFLRFFVQIIIISKAEIIQKPLGSHLNSYKLTFFHALLI